MKDSNQVPRAESGFAIQVIDQPWGNDLERQKTSRRGENITPQEQRLLETQFGLTGKTYQQWPGAYAYLSFLEDELADTGAACFEPLMGIFGLPIPVVITDLLGLINNVALILKDNSQDLQSIDDILQVILAPHNREVRDLDLQVKNRCRQAIFKTISWLTMVFTASREMAAGKFQIDLPPRCESIRHEQNMDNAVRPINRLVRGFGASLLPSAEQAFPALEHSSGELIYASSMNIYSLRMIDKIRIHWTSSMGCHLMFNPLTRTLILYRFPTFCAMTCMPERGNMVCEKILRDSFSISDQNTSMYKREVLLSYRLLFGQNRQSRQYFNKFERKLVTNSKHQYDPFLDIICGKPNGKCLRSYPRELWPDSSTDHNGWLLEQDVYSTSLDFPLLGHRLQKLQQFDLRQQPSRVRDLWRDRRNPLQWYTFWAVVIVGGVSIVLSFLQLLVSSLQLANL